MLSLLLAIGLGSSHAQDVEEAPPEEALPTFLEETEEPVEDAGEEAPEPETAGVSEAEFHSLEAAAFYKIGLELVARGAFDQAAPIFQSLLETYPDTEFAIRAEKQLELLESLATAPVPMRRAAMSGKGELAVSQGIAMPVILGLLLPGATFQPAEPLVPVTMGMAGLGVGIVGSVYLDKLDPVSVGDAMAIFTGEWLGAANGIAFSMIFPPRDYRGVYSETLIATLAGGTAGYFAGRQWEVDAGQMALINHGALWGSYLGLASMVFYQPDDEIGAALRTTAFLDLGAIAGGVFSHFFPMSRSRVRLITMSGAAGTAVAGGLAILLNFYGGLYDEAPTMALLLAGSGVGAGVGARLSRGMDAGLGLSAGSLIQHESGQWSVGLPMVTLRPAMDGSMALSVPLAQGHF